MRKLLIVSAVVLAAIYTFTSAPLPTSSKSSKLFASESAIPGRYIVVLANDSKAELESSLSVEAAANDLVANRGGSVDKIYSSALKGFAVQMSAEAANDLSNDPRVLFVEEDGEIWPSITAQSAPDWGLDRIDQADRPLNASYVYESDGAGVNAYIIDSGINPNHVDFGGRASVAFDALTDGQNGIDCRGHGTHVAGIVGSSVHGVAKAVTLRGVRVLPCSGSGQISDFLVGIDWVTANRVLPAVANVSINASGISPSMTTAITNSINSGVTYAISAGNFSADACNFSPANITAALVVGASTSSDNRAGYSNFGTCVDVFAPGHSITSTDFATNTGTRTLSGTSMSAPMVAGAAALYLKNNPTASPATVQSVIRNNATPNVVTNIDATSPNRLLSTWLDAQPPTPGRVRVIKEVRTRTGGTSSSTSFSYSATNLPQSAFALVDSDAPPSDTYENGSVFVFEAQDSIVISEGQVFGWQTSAINCVEEAMLDLPNMSNSIVDVTNRRATINVEQGETVTCTFVSEELSPSAAPVSVSGRVATEYGGAIRRTLLILRNAETGETWTTYSNSFGYFNFPSVPSSAFYIVEVQETKRYSFSPQSQSFTADDNIVGLNFIASER